MVLVGHQLYDGRRFRVRKQRKIIRMKRIGNLWERIISLDNLRLADEKARKGKGNSYGVRLHDKNRETEILKLHEALKNKTYRTSKYETFTIYEPKERLISRLPYYPDRIVHHALMNVLEPIWFHTFTHNTYSCIKGRGINGCMKAVDRIIKKYEGRPLYCLKIDIRKFYPSINHDIMKKIVRKKIKDKDVLWLLDEIIDSADGLPIGNFPSSYLANLYLCYVMHKVNERMKLDSTEYADDIATFAENKEVLHKCMDFYKAEIEGGLKVKIKDNWQIFPIAKNRYDKHGRALDYVGYKFYREQKLMRKSIKQNFARKCAKLNKREDITPMEYKQEISSWLGWAKETDSRNLLKKIIKKDCYESVLR